VPIDLGRVAATRLCAGEATPEGQSPSAQVQSAKNDDAREGRIMTGEAFTVNRYPDIALWKNSAIVAPVLIVEVRLSRGGEVRSN